MVLRLLPWSKPGNGHSDSKGKEEFAKYSQMGCLERAWALQVLRFRPEYQHCWLPQASISPYLEVQHHKCSHGIVTVSLSPVWWLLQRQHPVKGGPFFALPHLT